MNPKVSIVIPTYNKANILTKVIDSMLNLDYDNDYQIIVVDDGCSDNTREVLIPFKNRIKIITHQKNLGFSHSNNDAVEAAKYDYVAFMTDDCIAEKDWLKTLVSGFSNGVDAVAGVSEYQFTSFCCRKTVLLRVNGFDPSYNPTGYRADTDMSFKILDLGFTIKQIKGAKYLHDHPSPSALKGKIRYIYSRIVIHYLDNLLYKKHPERAKKYLDIKLGFIRNPIKDFRNATGMWYGDRRLKDLSSPQGIYIIRSNSPLHKALIFFGGVTYMLAVKLSRLYGSIKFGKVLL